MNNQLVDACKKYMALGRYDYALDCITNIYKDSKAIGRRIAVAYRKALTEQVQQGKDTAENMELIHRAYLLTAPDFFDDFMIALEWYRPADQKFWLVRREKLLSVCETLQSFEDGMMDELFLSMPPRVGKSTIVMFFIIWVMCRKPELTNLYSSFTEKVVKIFYNGILEVMTDTVTYDLLSIFPNFKLAKTDANDLLIDVGRKKRYPSITSRSISGTLNGACDASGYIIADDLIDGIAEAKNKELLDTKWGLVTNNLLARKKSEGKILWIGTRWSVVDCISNRIEMLQTASECAHIRYKIVNVPALNDYNESNFNYMFNKGFTTDDYRVIRASFELKDDLASFYAQYLGAPIERNGAVFDPSDLRYFNGELPTDIDPDRIFMAVDPAWGGGDYTASPIIYQYDNDLYVVDVVFSNGDKSVTQPLIAQKAIKWGVQAIIIEATRTTRSYAEGVDEKLKAQGYRVNIQTTTKNWTGTGKQQRIYDKSVDIKEFMVFLETGKRDKDYNNFMNNVFSFTIEGKVKHDDAPDSLSMAIVNAFMRREKATIVRRPF